MKFRSRPLEVDALRWTGENYDKIVELCPIAMVFQVSEGRVLKIPTLEGSIRVNPHDWLVRHDDGVTYSRVSESRMAELYEPMSEEP